jgi:hypothetical protein
VYLGAYFTLSPKLLTQKRDLFFVAPDIIALQSVPHELNASDRKAILAHVEGLQESEEDPSKWMYSEYTLPGRPTLFVKVCHDNLAQAATQDFFYRCALGDESAPRIPKVIDAFSSQSGDHVVVMIVGLQRKRP